MAFAIRLTLALTFFNFVAVSAARVVLSLYALTLGASPGAVGVLGGMFYVFPLLLSWPIGSMADRFGPRRLLLVGGLCGVGALLLPYFVREVGAFYASAAMSGLSFAFYHVTLQNLVGVLSKPSERARNFSNFSLVGAVTNFVGPLVAGFAIDHSGYANACLYVVGIALLPLTLLLLWSRRLPGGNPRHVPGGSMLKSLGEREVLVMLATGSLVQLGTDVFQFYMPVYGHELGMSASAIGSVLATFAAASFAVRIFLPQMIKRIGGEMLLACSFAMGALSFLLVPLSHSAQALAGVAFVFGMGMGCGMPLTVILMFSRTTEGRSGQTLGLRLTANNLVRVLGPVVFGSVGGLLGLAPVFWINALLMGTGAVLARPRRRQED